MSASGPSGPLGIRYDYLFESITKVRLSNIFFEFIN